MENYADWLAVAEGLAVEASRAVMSFFGGDFSTREKDDRSPVTEADLASDRILREGLLRNFPSHAVLTEEAGLSGLTTSEYVWLIDPLDGTKAFAKGIPGFCVMVALLRNGRPHLGVVVDPLDERLYRAIRGEGTSQSHQGKTEVLRVSPRRELNEMPWVVSTGFPEIAMERTRTLLRGPILPPINSVGIKVGLLLRQEADIYLNHHPVSYWDTAAPALLLEEAGGCFTTLEGGPLSYSLNPPFGHGVRTLASNGTRHSDLVSLLKNVFM